MNVNTMVHTERMLLWMRVDRAQDFKPFYAIGDYGPYCPIAFGNLWGVS